MVDGYGKDARVIGGGLVADPEKGDATDIAAPRLIHRRSNRMSTTFDPYSREAPR